MDKSTFLLNSRVRFVHAFRLRKTVFIIGGKKINIDTVILLNETHGSLEFCSAD